MPPNHSPLTVIKVGTNVLTDAHGAPDQAVLSALVAAVAAVHTTTHRVVLVSSGAMGFGQAILGSHRTQPATAVAARQLSSAVGQVSLMARYAELFARHGITIGQVLATALDFHTRDHYLNMRQCLTALLAAGVVPILNENDPVSVSELMFTDNDELAGLVASMLNAERLLFLTNVDGLYAGQPGASELIRELKPSDSIEHVTTAGRSPFGRGGMRSKLLIARRLANLGIQVHILNGKQPESIAAGLANRSVGTVIRAAAKRSSVKRRLSFADREVVATVTINQGALDRLRGPEPVSLLPIGITAIAGTCAKGDIVKVVTTDGTKIGIGRAEYGSEVLQTKLGQRRGRPFIHYNYLVLV